MNEAIKSEVAEVIYKAIYDLNGIKRGKNERVIPSAIMVLALLENIVERRLGLNHPNAFLNVDRGLPVKKQSINLKKEDMVLLLDEVFPKKNITTEFSDAIIYLDEIKECEQKSPITIELQKYDGELLYTSIIRAMHLPEYIFASSSLSELASSILNVNEGESFCDFASGVNLSTACITRGKTNVNIDLVEMFDYYATLTECMFFLCNKTNCNIEIGEGFSYKEKKYNKIFVDPPVKARLGFVANYFGIQVDDSTLATVLKAASLLSEKGRAVVTIPGSFLFGLQGRSYKETREYLVDNNLLKAVILLPSMWKATTIKTAMLVLEKNSNTTAMINIASDEDVKNFTVYDKLDRSRCISEESIAYITERINDESESDENSCHVTKEEIHSRDYILEPSLYIKRGVKCNRELSEINADIESTIDRVSSLLSMLHLDKEEQR